VKFHFHVEAKLDYMYVMYKINDIIVPFSGAKKIILLRTMTWFRPMAINFICANDKGDFVEKYKSDGVRRSFCPRESCLSVNVNKMT